MSYELTEKGKAALGTCSPYWPFKKQFDYDRNRGWFKSDFKESRINAAREWMAAYQQWQKENA